MSAPLKMTLPAVGGSKPQMRLTIVLLPEPFGPMRPTISPRGTARSIPSTARTPPKCLVSPWRSSIGAILAGDHQPLEGKDGPGVEQSARAHIHREHHQPAEQQIAPIAHEAKTFDQKALDEDDREEGAEYIGKAAENGIGDGEGRQHDAELHMLDMRRVMRENAAANTGNDAADRHRRDLYGSDVDAGTLCGDLILADRTQYGASARSVQPPHAGHYQGDHRPDEEHDVKRRPAILGKVTDLAEAFGTVGPKFEISSLHLIGEIEEEQAHGLSECDGRHHEHQALHPQGGEPDGASHRAGNHGGRAEGGDERPLREHREHAGDVGADREEAGLRETDLAGEQHAIGRQSEQRMNADDLHKSEEEIHRVATGRQSCPTGIANTPPGRNRRKANSNNMM